MNGYNVNEIKLQAYHSDKEKLKEKLKNKNNIIKVQSKAKMNWNWIDKYKVFKMKNKKGKVWWHMINEHAWLIYIYLENIYKG